MASTYLTRTPSSAGNRKTWTLSCWVKRTCTSSSTSGYNSILSTNVSNEGINIAFGDGAFTGPGNYFEVTHADAAGGGVTDWSVRTNQLFRDVSGWYHLVVAFDTTQSTTADRVKLYVNGSEVDKTVTTGPALNTDYEINNTQQHTIGRWQRDANSYFDGSMAHVHFIDGTTYDASAFGQTDSTTGIWKPKLSPSVTYGTNGFFLKFASSGSMGTDSSGNGNNFTVGAGNLTQTQDTPSNVFATLNPLDKTGSDVSTSNGNLSATWSNTNGHLMASTLAVTKGKWYYEFKQGTGSIVVGILNLDRIGDPQGYSYCPALGTKVTSFSYTSASYGATASIGDIIGVAYDLDADSITFYKNGTSQGTAFTSINSGTYAPFVGYAGGSTGGTASDLNFGNGYFGTTAVSSANSDGDGYGLFEYEVPSGYYALCTKNINTYG